MRANALISLLPVIAFGAAATTPAAVCDRYLKSDLVFTGSAENSWVTLLDTQKSPIHKRSEKSKRVRFLVREWFKGQQRDTVELWMTPGDCSLIIETGQTYLIYAHLNKDDGRMETNGCAGTAAIGNATADLAYLTAAQLGPAHATRLSGTAGSEGLNIQAKSGLDIRYAVTAGAGKFTFDGLMSGDWELSVNGGPAKAVHLDPSSCVDVQLADPTSPSSAKP